MRLKIAQFAVLALLICGFARNAVAQNPDLMTPEASTAKAKEVLGQLITALGGPAYLEAKESSCDGRIAQFGHNGDLVGYIDFKDYWRFPDKNRVDYGKKGNIINLYSGEDEAWTLTKDGVEPLGSAASNEFQGSLDRNINYLLRFRLKEDGMSIRYGGLDLVDMKPVEWVELTDKEDRVYRLAVLKSSHFLARSVVRVKDFDTQQLTEETTLYANWHLMGTVQSALQIEKLRDSRRIFQAFYNACNFNPNLAQNFFTKEALEQRFAETGGKKSKSKNGKD